MLTLVPRLMNAFVRLVERAWLDDDADPQEVDNLSGWVTHATDWDSISIDSV